MLYRVNAESPGPITVVAAKEKEVTSPNGQQSLDRMVDVLGYVREKGVRLWSANGQLHYKAPKGALTREEIENLRVSRDQIVALLESSPGGDTTDSRLVLRGRFDRAPLAFSQLAHWHTYKLRERRSVRHVASATRLRGRLNFDAFRQAVAENVRRHDALRTRIVVCDGVPTQEIAETGDWELRVNDLTALSERLRETEINRAIEKLILEPIDVAEGPLFGIRLLKLRHDEHVLIVAMDHIISDAFSMKVLLRDLLTAYVQALKGREFSLPEIAIQFADYAAWQRSTLKSWIQKHGAYWNERLPGYQRLRFPVDEVRSTGKRMGWDAVPLQIGRDLKDQLREWCRQRRTTLVMSVFTAYAALVLRWCDVSSAVIQYQSDGRVSSKIENTIGYFASTLFVRIELLDSDTFVDLVNKVTEEYCKAYTHVDFCYMESQLPQPEFTRNTTFNWVPQASKIDLDDLNGSEHAITCSPVRFLPPGLKSHQGEDEPVILLFDTDEEIVGDIYFPLNKFSVGTMERFCRNFLVFVRALLTQPEQRVQGISLL